MTTKYRLPDSLGGHEIVGPVCKVDDFRVSVTVLVGGQRCEVVLPAAMLVEAELAALRAFFDTWNEHQGRFIGPGKVKIDDINASIELHEAAGRVLATQEKAARVQPSQLAPDPFAEPVEVPWLLSIGDYETLAVYVDGDAVVTGLRGGNQNGLTPAETRNYARALWAAAAKADAPKEQP